MYGEGFKSLHKLNNNPNDIVNAIETHFLLTDLQRTNIALLLRRTPRGESREAHTEVEQELGPLALRGRSLGEWRFYAVLGLCSPLPRMLWGKVAPESLGKLALIRSRGGAAGILGSPRPEMSRQSRLFFQSISCNFRKPLGNMRRGANR